MDLLALSRAGADDLFAYNPDDPPIQGSTLQGLTGDATYDVVDVTPLFSTGGNTGAPLIAVAQAVEPPPLGGGQPLDLRRFRPSQHSVSFPSIVVFECTSGNCGGGGPPTSGNPVRKLKVRKSLDFVPDQQLIRFSGVGLILTFSSPLTLFTQLALRLQSYGNATAETVQYHIYQTGSALPALPAGSCIVIPIAV